MAGKIYKKHGFRGGKRAAPVPRTKPASNLKTNPLFVALDTARDTRSREPPSRHPREKTPRRVNELEQRLGLGGRSAVPVAKSRNVKARPVPTVKNPLAVALGLGRLPQGPAPKAKPDTTKRNSIRISNGRKSGNTVNNIPTMPSAVKGPVRANSNVRPARIAPSSTSAPAPVNNLTFKNASLIPFLRIENLDATVNESDIRMVLSTKLGPTLKIIKMNTVYNNCPAVTAEVFFLDDTQLSNYAKTLNDIVADGNSIKATIAYHSNIINSDKLWESVLKEVRMIKQEVLRQNITRK